MTKMIEMTKITKNDGMQEEWLRMTLNDLDWLRMALEDIRWLCGQKTRACN